ncbi:MAG: hypothetical protein MK066_08185 [Crocinitomicaceae bacterium]|nr:hypothetical protein [Crocinitomicaceae bacterium]
MESSYTMQTNIDGQTLNHRKGKNIKELKTKENDYLKLTDPAWEHLEIGLKSTLGEDHGFSLNNHALQYIAPSGKEYNSTQQKIIDRLNYLITNSKKLDIQVSVITRDTEIAFSDGSTTTLNKVNLNGATLTKRDPETQEVTDTVRIYLADKSILIDKEAGIVDQPDYMKGVNALHELAGHAYLRLSDTQLSINGTPAHNRTTENFVTEIMQIYQIGIVNSKEQARIYNKNIIKKQNKIRKKNNQELLPEVKVGDPRTLQGQKAGKHKK